MPASLTPAQKHEAALNALKDSTALKEDEVTVLATSLAFIDGIYQENEEELKKKVSALLDFASRPNAIDAIDTQARLRLSGLDASPYARHQALYAPRTEVRFSPREQVERTICIAQGINFLGDNKCLTPEYVEFLLVCPPYQALFIAKCFVALLNTAFFIEKDKKVLAKELGALGDDKNSGNYAEILLKGFCTLRDANALNNVSFDTVMFRYNKMLHTKEIVEWLVLLSNAGMLTTKNTSPLTQERKGKSFLSVDYFVSLLKEMHEGKLLNPHNYTFMIKKLEGINDNPNKCRLLNSQKPLTQGKFEELMRLLSPAVEAANVLTAASASTLFGNSEQAVLPVAQAAYVTPGSQP